MASIARTAQPELPLDLPRGADPDLLEAYERSDLAYQGITLEKAMKTPHILTCLQRAAQVLASIRIEGSVQ